MGPHKLARKALLEEILDVLVQHLKLCHLSAREVRALRVRIYGTYETAKVGFWC